MAIVSRCVLFFHSQGLPGLSQDIQLQHPATDLDQHSHNIATSVLNQPEQVYLYTYIYTTPSLASLHCVCMLIFNIKINVCVALRI